MRKKLLKKLDVRLGRPPELCSHVVGTSEECVYSIAYVGAVVGVFFLGVWHALRAFGRVDHTT